MSNTYFVDPAYVTNTTGMTHLKIANLILLDFRTRKIFGEESSS
jgi:hypothetical protein